MLTRKLQIVIASLLLCCSSAGAKAAPISLGDLNTALVSLELALENIFSVPGSSLTDITFLPVLTVADPGSYLHVDTFAEQQGLLNFNDLGVTAGGDRSHCVRDRDHQSMWRSGGGCHDRMRISSRQHHVSGRRQIARLHR